MLGEEFPLALEDIDADPAGNVRLDVKHGRAAADDVKEEEATLAQLGESIRAQGQLQSIVVYKDGGKYKLVAGFRRVAAAKLVGLDQLRAVEIPKNRVKLAQLAENINRVDLTAYEIAQGVVAAKAENPGIDGPTIGASTGLAASTVNNYLRIIKQVDKALLEYWRLNPKAIRIVPFLMTMAALPFDQQLIEFEAYKKAPGEWKAPTQRTEGGSPLPAGSGTAEGGGEASNSDEPGKPGKKEIKQLLADLSGGKFRSQGAEFVNGATAALVFVLGTGKFVDADS